MDYTYLTFPACGLILATHTTLRHIYKSFFFFFFLLGFTQIKHIVSLHPSNHTMPLFIRSNLQKKHLGSIFIKQLYRNSDEFRCRSLISKPEAAGKTNEEVTLRRTRLISLLGVSEIINNYSIQVHKVRSNQTVLLRVLSVSILWIRVVKWVQSLWLQQHSETKVRLGINSHIIYIVFSNIPSIFKQPLIVRSCRAWSDSFMIRQFILSVTKV